MGVGSRLFAAGYDRMMAGVERAALGEHRRLLLGGAHGAVLEIGGGTGANVPHYGSAVSELVLVEPLEAMARRLERRLAAHAGAPQPQLPAGSAHAPLERSARVPPARVLRARAEELPFADASFDTAVSTLVLCSVDSPSRALAELHRVLRPGGRLLFVEHVRADDERIARWQDRLNRVNRVVAQGCNCNRATLAAMEAAGFRLERVEHGVLPKAPPHLRPLVVGEARRP